MTSSAERRGVISSKIRQGDSAHREYNFTALQRFGSKADPSSGKIRKGKISKEVNGKVKVKNKRLTFVKKQQLICLA